MRTDIVVLADDCPDDVALTVWAFRKSGITDEIVVACMEPRLLPAVIKPDAI